ncbi:hypothetical protein [Hoeflea sp.]|uniref:hypothetical protein n=1 Tax=Hoeflea sp. TaxID=1940281 RepID=UPI003A8DD279
MPHSFIGLENARLSLRPARSAFLLFSLVSIIGGCVAVPLEQGTALSSYDELTSNKGRLTKAEYKVVSSDLAATRTVYIEPTTVSGGRCRRARPPRA